MRSTRRNGTTTETARRSGLSRRGLLRGIAAGTTVAGVGAAAAPASAAAQSQFGGWFTGEGKGGATKNFTGEVVDRTGQDQVTITVGAEGNGGTFAFAPPAVRVSPGTTVTFEWASDTHNIFVESQPDGATWKGHESIENEGFTHSHTFETKGVYKYYCQPHLTMGMKGAIVVGPAPGSSRTGGSGASKQAGEGPGGQPEGYVSVWEGFFAGSVLVAMVAPIVLNALRRGRRADTAVRKSR